ncbi:MAG: hypothetical protein KJI72_00425 [Patescibacteria group bacterium]|nr:hypothetical protein [Patescibacteria group bacterium]
MQEDIEQKPLSYYFDRAVVEEMLELLRSGYTIPLHGFGAFLGASNQWRYVLIRFRRRFLFITIAREDKKVFRFERQFPFVIGTRESDGDSAPEETFLKGLQDLLEKV